LQIHVAIPFTGILPKAATQKKKDGGQLALPAV
jgi:hypothetical protein